MRRPGKGDSVRVVCPNCAHSLEMHEKFLGRKLLCSRCETKYRIPGAAAPGAAPVEGRTETEPAPAPARRPPTGGHAAVSPGLPAEAPRTAEDPKRYLKVAAERGFVTGAMLEKCQGAYERYLLHSGRGQKQSIGEFLVERGFVTPEENRMVVLVLNRSSAIDKRGLHAAARTPSRGPGMRECPNCFEAIHESARTCRYCGVLLEEPEVSEQCPNCFSSQAPGGPFCRNCGANMSTGLIGDQTRRRCPKCGVLAAGMETICVVCRTPFDRPEAAVLAAAAARGIFQRIYDHRGFLLLGLVILGAFWLFRNRDRLSSGVSEQLYGAEEASLRKRLTEFTLALKYGNHDGIGKLIRSGGKTLAGDDVRRAWTVLTGAPAPEDGVEEATVQRLAVDGLEATVYADLVIRFAKVEKPKPADPDLGAIGGLLGGGSPSTKKVQCTWRWAFVEDRWYCVGPLR